METTNKSVAVTVSVQVQAPITKVWNYFNSPEHVLHWCAASDDWHVPFAESDFREGGKSKTTMAAKDGSFGFDFEWTYTRIREHEIVEYTIADGRNVFIRFTEKDGGTEITETFDTETTNPVDMQRAGWQAILDNFKKYTESH